MTALAWGLISTLAFRSDPFTATSGWALMVDVVLASSAMGASVLAFEDQPILFYGGYPFLVVLIASIRSRRSLVVVVSLFSATSLVIFGLDAVMARQLTAPVSQALVYIIGGWVAAWVIDLLRASDREAKSALDAAARAEERARISGHLHDSVLQSLALIQRSATDESEVVSLARRQERELRAYLHGQPLHPELGFAEGIRHAAAGVEERFRVPIDVVTVGDDVWSEKVDLLVSAAREAMVNASKHSHAPEISVYAEADGSADLVFVRDRGVGFELADVPSDRMGISRSIEERLGSVGGSARLRTSPGTGTEWRLEVPT